MDLTQAFLDGFNSQDVQTDNPFIWSSPNWLAFDAGARFAKLGTSTPTKCKASRGYTLRVFSQANEWLAIPSKNLAQWTFDRRG